MTGGQFRIRECVPSMSWNAHSIFLGSKERTRIGEGTGENVIIAELSFGFLSNSIVADGEKDNRFRYAYGLPDVRDQTPADPLLISPVSYKTFLEHLFLVPDPLHDDRDVEKQDKK